MFFGYKGNSSFLLFSARFVRVISSGANSKILAELWNCWNFQYDGAVIIKFGFIGSTELLLAAMIDFTL